MGPVATLLLLIVLASPPPEDLPRPKGRAVKAVRVGTDKLSLRVLPPDKDLITHQARYRPLSEGQAAKVAAIAKVTVTGPSSSALLVSEMLMDLRGSYISQTYANGLQHFAEVASEAGRMPTMTMKCTFAPPVSLGQKGDLTYAFVQVSCATDDPKWRSFKLGMTLQGEHVADVALNLGDDIVLFGEPGKDRP